jgi:dynein heavy chain
VHAFYAFSLNAFVTVFARGIDNATGGKKRQVKLGFRQIAKRIMGKFDWNLDLLTQLLPSKKAGQKKNKVKRDPIAEPTDAELAKRMQSLLDTTTFTVFNYTRRGLFDRDKLIVSTLLTFAVLQADGQIVDKEMDMLIRAPKVSELDSNRDIPDQPSGHGHN